MYISVNLLYERRYYKNKETGVCIYETDTSYYFAEYDNANNNINKNIQKIIDKSNVEYTWKIVNG